MRRLEENAERNAVEHARFDRNLEALRASMVEQKQNVDKLLGVLRESIDRLPPENLKGPNA